LSFDDTDVDGWYSFFTREDIETSGAKATFYVTFPQHRTNTEIERLKVLEALGHEIGLHGYMHLDAVEYITAGQYRPAFDNLMLREQAIQTRGGHSDEKEALEEERDKVLAQAIQGYCEREIEPAIREIVRHGFRRPESFAYPYGAQTEKLNAALLKYFAILRGTESGLYAGDWAEECSVSIADGGARFVRGRGIGVYPLGAEDKLLEVAMRERRIEILYGHAIWNGPEDGRKEGAVGSEYLKEFIDLVCKRGGRFYTMSELE
jgi:peptidoglycan/xylan/chitin deacetylase (PgdA/CDA1 family)